MNKNLVGSIPATLIKLLGRPIFSKLMKYMDEYGFIDKSINDKLIKSIPKDENVLIGSVGSSSFYYNPEVSSRLDREISIREYEKMGVDPNKLDNLNSYVYNSLLNNRKLIIISLLQSSTPVIAHELGHMFIDLNGGAMKFIQNNRILRSVSGSDRLKSMTSFSMALFGNTVSSYLLPVIISSPTLIKEFMASKIGYDLIKSVGATEDQLGKSMKCFASAWGTYLLGSMYRSMGAQIKGSVLRSALLKLSNLKNI